MWGNARAEWKIKLFVCTYNVRSAVVCRLFGLCVVCICAWVWGACSRDPRPGDPTPDKVVEIAVVDNSGLVGSS